jgi:hypothetical protein
MPESAIICGLGEALSWMETVPDFAPLDFGKKVTLDGAACARGNA